jgi:hypothetical protein
MDTLISKDLTALTVPLPVIAPPALVARIASAPCYQSDIRDEFAAASADEALDLARMGPSLIDIVIADVDLTRGGDGIATIDKTPRLAGYNIPVVLLMDQASLEIGKPRLGADVSTLRKPVDVEELKVLSGELLKYPKAHSLGLTENRCAAIGLA